MNLAWESILKTLGELRADEPMARHTTLGVGGAARWFFRPASRLALVDAIRMLPADMPVLPLGRGSNLLVGDSGFDGIVIDLSEIRSLEARDNQVRAGAGTRMSRLARYSAEHGLSGLEFMATVPGDVGGGIAMNAGAFGQQVSDTLSSIDVVHRDGRCEQLKAAVLEMGYRHTRLPAGSLVLGACFALRPDAPEAIRARMDKMRRQRSQSQPLSAPNCGSVFKNPPQAHAARLIEDAGLKGYRIGHAQISDVHANFIVNEGGATSADVLSLIRRAQAEVENKFGIQLEPEVRIVGETA